MKSVYEWFKNNIRPVLQFLLLGGAFFAPRIFKITELIKDPPKLEASQKICDYVFYFACDTVGENILCIGSNIGVSTAKCLPGRTGNQNGFIAYSLNVAD